MKKVAVWSTGGMIALFLILVLSFCGSVADAPNEESDRSEETAEMFALSVNGKNLEVDEYNDGREKETCTEFELTAKTDSDVHELFFSITAVDVDIEVTVFCGDATPMTKLVGAGDNVVRITLDTAVNTANAIEVRLSAQATLQSVIVYFNAEV